MEKKNFKKIILAAIILLFILTSINNAFAHKIIFEAYINSQKIENALLVLQDQEYVSFEVLSKKLDLNILYDKDKNIIYLKDYDKVLAPVLNNGIAYINLKALAFALKGRILFDYQGGVIKLDTAGGNFSGISANEIISKINAYIGKDVVVLLPASSATQANYMPSGLKYLPELSFNGDMNGQIYVKKIKCKYCNGSGDCSYCGGRGKINFQMCPDCNGAGYRPGEFKKCGTCEGAGKVGQVCPICDGRGICTWCYGKGKY